MLKEFKAFITQGNVLDLAIGIIIGGAFGKIVTSLVDDIIMPIVGMLMGGQDFSKLAITVGSANVKYGNFIQVVVQFLIVAYVIFILVKAANRAGLTEKKADEKA
ncbi:MAG: large conductance mechanosensitive channel protein MscL [Arcicella sp.]|nr:large conductance mechanosensitive channel protein MscL [Arcicella sp.]